MPDEVVIKISTQAQLEAAQRTAAVLQDLLSKTRGNDQAAKEYRATLDQLNASIKNNHVAHSAEIEQLKNIIPFVQSLGLQARELRGRMKALQEITGGEGKPGLFNQMKSDLLGVMDAMPGMGEMISRVFKMATGPVGAMTVAIGSATEAMEKFSKTELLWARLDTQLARSGQLFDGNRQKYQALMEQMADTTIGTSDEQWGAIILRLNQFGRTTDQVGKDLGTIRNLSARMGTGIESAAMAYERALNGSFYMLQRYGIMVPQHMSQLEKMRLLNQQLADSQGYWDAAMKTSIGSWDMMKNNLDRLTTTLGRHLEAISPLKYIYAGVGLAAGELAKVMGGTLPEAVGGLENQFRSMVPTMEDLRRHQEAARDTTLRQADAFKAVADAVEQYKNRVTETQEETIKLAEIQKSVATQSIRAEVAAGRMSEEQGQAAIARVEGGFSRSKFNVQESAIARQIAAAESGKSAAQNMETNALGSFRSAQAGLQGALSSGNPGDIARAQAVEDDARKRYVEAHKQAAQDVYKFSAEIERLNAEANKLRITFAGENYDKIVDVASKAFEEAVKVAEGRLQANPNMSALGLGQMFGLNQTRLYGVNATVTNTINSQLGQAGIEDLQAFQQSPQAQGSEIQKAIYIAIEQKKAVLAKLHFIQAEQAGDSKAMGEAQDELSKINTDLMQSFSVGNKNKWTYGGTGPVITQGGGMGYNAFAPAPGFRPWIPQYGMGTIQAPGGVMAAAGGLAAARGANPATAAFGPGATLGTSPETLIPEPGKTAPEITQGMGINPPFPQGRDWSNTTVQINEQGDYIFRDKSTGIDLDQNGQPMAPSGSPAQSAAAPVGPGGWQSTAISAGVALGTAAVFGAGAKGASWLLRRAAKPALGAAIGAARNVWREHVSLAAPAERAAAAKAAYEETLKPGWHSTASVAESAPQAAQGAGMATSAAAPAATMAKSARDTAFQQFRANYDAELSRRKAALAIAEKEHVNLANQYAHNAGTGKIPIDPAKVEAARIKAENLRDQVGQMTSERSAVLMDAYQNPHGIPTQVLGAATDDIDSIKPAGFTTGGKYAGTEFAAKTGTASLASRLNPFGGWAQAGRLGKFGRVAGPVGIGLATAYDVYKDLHNEDMTTGEKAITVAGDVGIGALSMVPGAGWIAGAVGKAAEGTAVQTASINDMSVTNANEGGGVGMTSMLAREQEKLRTDPRFAALTPEERKLWIKRARVGSGGLTSDEKAKLAVANAKTQPGAVRNFAPGQIEKNAGVGGLDPAVNDPTTVVGMAAQQTNQIAELSGQFQNGYIKGIGNLTPEQLNLLRETYQLQNPHARGKFGDAQLKKMLGGFDASSTRMALYQAHLAAGQTSNTAQSVGASGDPATDLASKAVSAQVAATKSTEHVGHVLDGVVSTLKNFDKRISAQGDEINDLGKNVKNNRGVT